MDLNDILLRYDAARLCERFAASVSVDPATGCHEWQGQVDTTPGHLPYGQFAIGHGRRYRAHRVAWVLFVGTIPVGAQVLHECDNARCVNPKHLFLGDRTVNMRDMVRKNRSPHGLRNGSVKLTEEQVRAIRFDGRPQRDIARYYGVAQSTVSGIKTGAKWRHLA